MKTSNNPFDAINTLAFLVDNEIFVVHKEEKFEIRGVKTKSPILIHHVNMVQPAAVDHLAKSIVKSILEHDKLRKEQHNKRKSQKQDNDAEIPVYRKTVFIAGSGFGQVIAYEVSKLMGLKFLPITGPMLYLKDKSEPIVYVSDIIGTGKTTASAVSLINNAGGNCTGIFSVFDYGFNLSTKELIDIPIYSLLNLKEIDNMSTLKTWMTQNLHLFGKGNRIESKKAKVS